MPLPFAAEVLWGDIDLSWLPGTWNILKSVLGLALLTAIKWYCSGASNTSERKMHSKVVMITGGTSGIGAVVALDLAKRGAQIVLLTHQAPSDIFLVDFIEDLRERSGSELIHAEQVDLSSLLNIRQFATKWIDNAPPRRLDMIILCAATLTPPGKKRRVTKEGIEETWMINYLANFHLLSILSPAIRAQPPDRDLRILFATCSSSYIASPAIDDGSEAMMKKDWSPSKAYTRSKLALMTFGHAFQKHIDSYKRPDNFPSNARVMFIDPGNCRTPGLRRWFSRGTLWGLAVYMLLWQSAWLFLKSADGGAQSFLYAAMEARFGRGEGGRFIKECREMDMARTDVQDEQVAERLWKTSEKLIERVEREEAVRRALEKKETEAKKKKKQENEQKDKEEKIGEVEGVNETVDVDENETKSKNKSRRQKTKG